MSESCLLAVFAHPDDEAFRCGGTLARLARKGVSVHVLTFTRGQAGSRGAPPLCTPEELPALREKELRCACAALGIRPPDLLDYQDGLLSEADPDQLVAHILQAVDKLHPQVMLSFGPDGLSGHPDHVTIGQCAVQAFHSTEAVFALYTPAVPQSLATRLGMKQIHAVPDETIAITLDVSSTWDAKMSAIRCHRTQLGESPILSAAPQVQRMFLGVEHFCLAASRSIPDGINFDLLDWLES